MNTPQPPRNDTGSAARTGTGTPGTVGVYDRPDSADKPSMLPKIITAVIVVAMLVLTYLFWPKSTTPSTRDAAPAAATSAPAGATSGSTTGGTGSTTDTGTAPPSGIAATPGGASGTGTSATTPK